MTINVKKGDKVKIRNFIFDGREKLEEGKLLRAMKETKEKKFWRLWKKSKFIKNAYKDDLDLLVDKYAENGYRDARVVSDTVIRVDDNHIDIKLKIEEGNKYYFGDIDFVGITGCYCAKELPMILNPMLMILLIFTKISGTSFRK